MLGKIGLTAVSMQLPPDLGDPFTDIRLGRLRRQLNSYSRILYLTTRPIANIHNTCRRDYTRFCRQRKEQWQRTYAKRNCRWSRRWRPSWNCSGGRPNWFVPPCDKRGSRGPSGGALRKASPPAGVEFRLGQAISRGVKRARRGPLGPAASPPAPRRKRGGCDRVWAWPPRDVIAPGPTEARRELRDASRRTRLPVAHRELRVRLHAPHRRRLAVLSRAGRKVTIQANLRGEVFDVYGEARK